MKIHRRGFLGVASGAVAGAMAGCDLGTLDFIPEREFADTWTNGDERFAAFLCDGCAGRCGLLARIVDGKVVGVRGNPSSPINREGLCSRGLASRHLHYSKDRIKKPLRASGGRGSGQWQEISWDEALKEVGSRLGALRKGNEAHALGLLVDGSADVTSLLWQRFAHAFGTPNLVRWSAPDPEQAPTAARLMQGTSKPIAYDIGRANVVLSFDCDILGSWRSPVAQRRAFAELHRARETRGRYIHVSQGASVSAAKADRWISLNPGTEGAFALGLANVIIRERLYDKTFVANLTHGFEDWTDAEGNRHEGFETVVLRDYHPRQVAAVTGIEVETIIDVARDFALRQPGVALGEKEGAYDALDIYTRCAIHSLNALVGNIGRAGGVLVQNGLGVELGPAVAPDAAATASLAKPRVDGAGVGAQLLAQDAVQSLPANIKAKSPYGLKALLVHGVNPLFDHPKKEAYREALATVPFVVAVSPFMDETCAVADIVLPTSSALEAWQGSLIGSLPTYSVFAVSQPVIEAAHDTRSAGDVVLGLAGALDAAVKGAFPWSSYEAALKGVAEELYKRQRGYVFASRETESVRLALQEQGLWEAEFASFDSFWDALVERGGWCDLGSDLPDMGRRFETPSSKFEFYSQILRQEFERGGGEAAIARIGVKAKGDLRYLPHWEAPDAEAGKAAFPLVLTTNELTTLAGLHSANVALLQEYPSVRARGAHWDSWIEINPLTAAKHGIHEGDSVWVESSRGRLRTVAHIDKGVRPGSVNFPVGQGHTAVGRYAKDRGKNPYDLVVDGRDAHLGVGVLNQTRVKVYRG